MRNQIKKTSIATYYFDADKSLLIQLWTNASDDMDDETYKNEMLNYLNYAVDLKPKIALIDTKSFNYTIAPDMQQWVDDNISLKANKIIKKIAFLLPSDLFAQVSIQQTMDESQASQYKYINYFNSEEDAIQWLQE